MSENHLATAIATFQIQDVFVMSSRSSVVREFNQTAENFPFSAQIRHRVEPQCLFQERLIAQTGDRVLIMRRYVETAIRLVKPEEDDSSSTVDEDMKVRTIIGEVEATFAADYLVVTGEQPAQEVMSAFSENVLFHVWPYWREYAQNALVRMRLPPVILPMFKLRRVQQQPKSEDVARQSRE